jgi:glycosyltransferase involved in cell wall biosynthesis
LPFGLLAAHSRPEHGRPVWIVCHSGGVHLFASLPMPIRRRIGAVLVAGCELLSFVTPGLRSRFLKAVGPHADILAPRCQILPMGVKTQAFEAVRPDPDGPITVVARLTRLKGVDQLLRAAPRGRRLRLIGDGPERARLVRLGRKLGLRLETLGEVEPSRIPELLDGCALAVIPSRRLRTGRSEGLPTFALEALAAGLPLLTTTTWDMPTNLTTLKGVFRVADSIGGLGLGLERGLAYAKVRHPEDEAARRAAARAFDWLRIGEQVESRALSL